MECPECGKEAEYEGMFDKGKARYSCECGAVLTLDVMRSTLSMAFTGKEREEFVEDLWY